MRKCDVLVIGAGASGLICAGMAAKLGKNVILLEKNHRPARKVMISGKGRCNLTNSCSVQEFISCVPRNGRFLYSAISRFSPQDTIDFFESIGLKLKTERGKRVFPVSDKAVDVVDTLVAFAKGSGAKILQGTASEVKKGEDGFFVSADSGQYEAASVVIATGGVSYPVTGSTGDGYKFAREFGHSIISPRASLVPLDCREDFCRELQGLSLKNIAVKVTDNTLNKIVYTDFGELLFTHFGVSGPIVLSASAHMPSAEDGRYSVDINLKPALSEEQLEARIQRDFNKFANKNLQNSLVELLPRALIPVIIKNAGLDGERPVNQATKEMRRALLAAVRALRVNVSGFRPIAEAVITSGGVDVKGINPKTMESKLVPCLFFAGETIDVDAYTGGFNMQIAFSTGYLAGHSV